jgi:hypothetical protein
MKEIVMSQPSVITSDTTLDGKEKEEVEMSWNVTSKT